MKAPLIKKVLNVIGTFVGICGIVFVALKIHQYWGQISDESLLLRDWLILFLLSFIYFIINIFLAYAWRLLLKHLKIDMPFRWVYEAYGVSQIGKYIPGNIFQFIGRQTIGQSFGLPAIPLAKSILWELGILVFTGCIFILLILPHYLRLGEIIATWIFIFVVIIIFFVTYHFYSKKIALCFLNYMVFLICSAVIFMLILILVSQNSIPIEISFYLFCCGAYVVAWLAGLITPGAPGGLGVREFVLMILLKDIITEKDLLFSVLLGRVVTVCGDFYFYLIAFILSIINKRLGN